MTLLTKIYVSFAAVGILLAAIISFSAHELSAGGFATSASQQCTASTSAIVIGNQVSLTIVSAAGRRANLRVQQPINATNTVTLGLTASAVTSAGGLQLTPATTTSPVNYMDIGLNTDMNYTGPVQAITNTGSTTVLVTQCLF